MSTVSTIGYIEHILLIEDQKQFDGAVVQLFRRVGPGVLDKVKQVIQESFVHQG